MNLLKKWWFWAILIVVLIVIVAFIYLYTDGKDGEINEDKCTSQGCEKCGNSCIPWELAIRASCLAPGEEFECECVDERCVKK